MKIKFKNEFHKTETGAYVKFNDKGVGIIKRAVINRLNRELCGNSDCCCADELGEFDGYRKLNLIGDDYYNFYVKLNY